MAACSSRSFGTSRPTVHNPSVKTPKRTRSTMGEIQRMGSETCRDGPQRAQLILWKSNKPTPSTSPATIANQRARSSNDPRLGRTPPRVEGTSVVVGVLDIATKFTPDRRQNNQHWQGIVAQLNNAPTPALTSIPTRHHPEGLQSRRFWPASQHNCGPLTRGRDYVNSER